MNTTPQRTEVLEALRAGPVCGASMLDRRIPRYAARIFELRRAGYPIETRKCQNATHAHETAQIEYVLDASQKDAGPSGPATIETEGGQLALVEALR